MTDYLTGVSQKITDKLIKIVFLGEVKTTVYSDIKSKFSIMGF